MVLVLEGRQQGLLQVDAAVLLSRLDLRRFLRVQWLCLIAFEVDFNSVHAVNTLPVPGRLTLEQGSQLASECFVLSPVLNKVSLHKLIIQDQHWEVKLALLVDRDGLVHNLRQIVDLLSKFDFVSSQASEHFQLLVIFALVDQLDLAHCFLFFGQLDLALGGQFFDLNGVGVLH